MRTLVDFFVFVFGYRCDANYERAYKEQRELKQLESDHAKLHEFLSKKHDQHYLDQARIACDAVHRRIMQIHENNIRQRQQAEQEAESKLCLEVFFLREKYVPATPAA